MNATVRLVAEWKQTEGLSDHEIARQIVAGSLVRVRRGACAPAEELTAVAAHLRLARAVARQRADPVLSHVTAAAAWGLPVDRAQLGRVWVTRRTGHPRAIRDVRETQAPLRPRDVVSRAGLTCTAPARTVVDLARTTGLEWGVIAADAALQRGLCTHAELSEAVALARRRHGVSRAARAVDFADASAESPLESVSRLNLDRAGLPAPVLQYRVCLDDMFLGRADFAWPEFRLLGECDGASKYGALLAPAQSALDAVVAEKERENTLRDADWSVVRWGWDVAWDSLALGRRVRQALHRQGWQAT